ncbi:MAG: hypothetical protein WBM50_15440 [Acidimicrobiales bacterium]
MTSTSAQTRNGRRMLLAALGKLLVRYPGQADLVQAIDVAVDKIDGGDPPPWLLDQSVAELQDWQARLLDAHGRTCDNLTRDVLSARAAVVEWAIQEMLR